MTIKMVAAGIALSLATGAYAECPTASYGTGTVHPLTPSKKGDVDLIVSMSMMPKMLHVDYKSEHGKKLDCTLTAFDAAGGRYTLLASDTTKGTDRVAVPKDKNGTIAELVPVTNLIEAIEAFKQGKTAPVSGYMLLTLAKTDTTGLRLYDGIPNQQTLVADMTAALTGSLRPVFRNGADGKSAVFVPGS